MSSGGWGAAERAAAGCGKCCGDMSGGQVASQERPWRRDRWQDRGAGVDVTARDGGPGPRGGQPRRSTGHGVVLGLLGRLRGPVAGRSAGRCSGRAARDGRRGGWTGQRPGEHEQHRKQDRQHTPGAPGRRTPHPVSVGGELAQIHRYGRSASPHGLQIRTVDVHCWAMAWTLAGASFAGQALKVHSKAEHCTTPGCHWRIPETQPVIEA